MKKLLTTTLLALPALAFAGGAGSGVNLGDYNIVEPTSTVETSAATSSLLDSSEAPTVSSARSTTSERRRGTGYRTTSTISRAPGTTTSVSYIYSLNGVVYNDYRALVNAVNGLDQTMTEYTFNGQTYTSYEALMTAVTSLLRSQGIYFLNGVLYTNYWDWVTAYRAQNNADLGVTRITTDYRNYGNAYELSTGLEPIDPKDNMYRGQSREDERQSAAQLKMMRLRGLR